LATSFDLQSHHQAILNYTNVGTLCGSAHIWDPKMFTFLTNFKISDFNKEHTSSLKMI